MPFIATAPLQPPDARHLSASVALQVKFADSPVTTLVGEALKVTVGDFVITWTCAVPDAEPPGPVQVNMYVEASVSGAVVAVPLVGRVPDQAPDAVQLCASVVLHCNVVVLFT